MVVIDNLKLIVSKIDGAKPDEIRKMAESIKAKDDSAIAVIACVNGASGNIAAACGKEAVEKGILAGKLVAKVAALTGGKGGGRPDSAMAGVGDTAKLDSAMMQVDDIVREFLGI